MDMTTPTTWTHVCSVSDIPRLGSRVVKRADGDVALFRTANDEVFALHDHCPHKGGALSQGIVHGKTVTCPLHGWNIAFETGEACAPDEGCTMRFAVKVDGEAVFVQFA